MHFALVYSEVPYHCFASLEQEWPVKHLLLFLMVVFGCMAISWQILKPEQRQAILTQTGMEQKVEELLTALPKVRTSEATGPEDAAPDNPIVVQAGNNLHQIAQQFNCIKPKTEAIEEAAGSQIYTWIDANGKMHFSDSPPENANARNLSHKYVTEQEFFDLHVVSPDGSVPPLLKEQLDRDIRAIYRYLTDELALDHLRKVKLNLKIFNAKQAFAHYQQSHAPNLQGAAGFYSALNNEAVVFRQPVEELTKRVARHEATHVIMAGLYGLTPIWLNEGLAEAFADYRNLALSREFIPAAWLVRDAKNLLQNGAFPALEDYLALSPGAWQAGDPQLMYTTAWALASFLLQNPQAKPVLLGILTDLAQTPCLAINPADYIGRHYAGGMSEFESAWLAWLHKRLG